MLNVDLDKWIGINPTYEIILTKEMREKAECSISSDAESDEENSCEKNGFTKNACSFAKCY